MCASHIFIYIILFCIPRSQIFLRSKNRFLSDGGAVCRNPKFQPLASASIGALGSRSSVALSDMFVDLS